MYSPTITQEEMAALPSAYRAQARKWAFQSRRNERWKFLTEGLPEKSHMTNALEQCLDLALCEGTGLTEAELPLSLREETLIANVPVFTTISLGMIRRVFPELIANIAMSTQPMSGPTAKIFTLDFFRSVAGPADQNVQVTNRTYANSGGEGSAIKEVSLNIVDGDVSAVAKKLKYVFSIESGQNLAAYHALNMEDELFGAMGDEMAREINADSYEELLNGLSVSGGTRDAGTIDFDATAPLVGDTSSADLRAFNETLYDKLVEADNLVYKKRFKRTNIIFTGPDGGMRLEKLRGFSPQIGGETGANNTAGISSADANSRFLFGTLQKRWTVYVDPAFPEIDPVTGRNIYLLMLKGDRVLQAGTIWAPWILNWISDSFTNPETQKTARSMLSRYAIKKLISDYYARVHVQS